MSDSQRLWGLRSKKPIISFNFNYAPITRISNTPTRGALELRYSLETIQKMEAEVIAGLDKLPSNAVALGVEQIIIDLHGGVGTGMVSNINNATIKEIYILEARTWLDANLPNWEAELAPLK